MSYCKSVVRTVYVPADFAFATLSSQFVQAVAIQFCRVGEKRHDGVAFRPQTA
jgi:hypothetical protein